MVKRNKLLLVMLVMVALIAIGYLLVDYYVGEVFNIHTEWKSTVHKLTTLVS
jgi:hypothetical protein